MNENNVINLINEISAKYQLTQMQMQSLITRYHNDNRDLGVVKKEIIRSGGFYQIQNRLNTIINNTPQLSPGKNFYLSTFDSTGHLVLQPVAINVTNPETNEVLVDESLMGKQQQTRVDDIEIAICQIGRLMNFDISEEYRVYDSNKQKNSIIIRKLTTENEFYDVDNLKKRFTKLITNGKLKKESWVESVEKLTVANTKSDYKLIIDYGLNVLRSLPSILEEDFKQLETKYFDMLIFDSLINQSERNFKDYGILCNKVTKRYSFSPLFDNIYPSYLKNNDVISLNGITCNRYELIEYLFYNYYDKIKTRVTDIITNKERYLKTVDMILKYNVDLSAYNMVLNNIITNINYFERLNNERNTAVNNPNGGFVNIIQLVIGLGIIMIFSVLIGYLLYTIS